MPDLPNVGVERDMESFREFFESPLFRADGLKIYPTLVIRGTGLYELWKTGRYVSNIYYYWTLFPKLSLIFLKKLNCPTENKKIINKIVGIEIIHLSNLWTS